MNRKEEYSSVSNFGWYCPDCGTNHANITAACPRKAVPDTAGGLPVGEATAFMPPVTGYGIRKCRGGHYVHVARLQFGCRSVMSIFQTDPNGRKPTWKCLSGFLKPWWRQWLD